MERVSRDIEVMRLVQLLLVLAACLHFAAGCKHTRYSAFSTVDGEMQKIVTRNRYTLVGIKFADQDINADILQANLKSRQFTNDYLKKFQPDVFSDDGIKFMIRSTPLPQTTEYGWTPCTYLLSLTVLPLCSAAMGGEHIVVDVLNNPDARGAFDLYGRGDQALSLFCPLTPLLFFIGDAATPGSAKIGSSVSRHLVNYIDDRINDNGGYMEGVACNNETYYEFFAYAMAAVLKKMENDGLIDESRGRGADRATMPPADIGEKFEIVSFKKEDGFEHRYDFTLRFCGSGDVSAREIFDLKKLLRALVRNDYNTSFPDVPAESLIVDVSMSPCNGMMTGKVVVLSLSVESLRYDANRRTGLMRVRIGENQFEDARLYARRNIESLVRDKNVVLDARAIPPAAKFYLLEESANGQILELTFRVE